MSLSAQSSHHLECSALQWTRCDRSIQEIAVVGLNVLQIYDYLVVLGLICFVGSVCIIHCVLGAL